MDAATSDTRIEVHPEHQHRTPAEIAAEEARAAGSLHVPPHAPTPPASRQRSIAERVVTERVVTERGLTDGVTTEPSVILHGPHPTHCVP